MPDRGRLQTIVCQSEVKGMRSEMYIVAAFGRAIGMLEMSYDVVE